METSWQNGDQPPHESEGESSGKVVTFRPRLAALPALNPEPFLSDEERRELRAMLAWYRVVKPQFDAIKRNCPTARFLLAED